MNDFFPKPIIINTPMTPGVSGNSWVRLPSDDRYQDKMILLSVAEHAILRFQEVGSTQKACKLKKGSLITITPTIDAQSKRIWIVTYFKADVFSIDDDSSPVSLDNFMK